jgi:6-phospho-3-hexuloisomerase
MQLRDWFQINLDELKTMLDGISPIDGFHLGEIILTAERVFVAGQGRTGLVARMFAMRLMQIGLEAYIVGETLTPAIRSGDLLIAASGSGETPGVVRVAQKARELGARVAVVTCTANSSLAKVGDHLTLLPGKSIKTSTQVSTRLPLANVLEHCTLIFLDCVGAWLAVQKGATNQSMMTRHANLE